MWWRKNDRAALGQIKLHIVSASFYIKPNPFVMNNLMEHFVEMKWNKFFALFSFLLLIIIVHHDMIKICTHWEVLLRVVLSMLCCVLLFFVPIPFRCSTLCYYSLVKTYIKCKFISKLLINNSYVLI